MPGGFSPPKSFPRPEDALAVETRLSDDELAHWQRTAYALLFKVASRQVP